MSRTISLALLGLCILLVAAYVVYEAYEIATKWANLPDHLRYTSGGALLVGAIALGTLGFLGYREFQRAPGTKR